VYSDIPVSLSDRIEVDRPTASVRGRVCRKRADRLVSISPNGQAHRMSTEIDALLARAHKEIDEGLLPSCQLAIARHGEIELFEAFGDATTDTRYIVFSATKAFVASLVWVLIGEGAIDVSKRVVDYIPEFAPNGKDVITVEQVLLHTSGFPHAPLGIPDMLTREDRVARMADWRLNWEPDSTYEYHPESAHWVLVEIIDRVTGVDYRDLL
jgi:CubicO group peptidase (beta-lactamase class C family)